MSDPQVLRGRIPALDGLRAIACLTVFLANFHHSMGMNVSGRAATLDLARFAESGIGVVLLIVLSGGLLSLPFWRHLSAERPAVSWRSFAFNRAVRIVPPYYACLIAIIMATGSWRDPWDAAAHFLFVNNLWESSFYGLSPQFWTIGMFVQFYCLLPLLFAGVRRLTHRGPAAFAIVATMAIGAYLLHWGLMASRERWLMWPVSIVASNTGFVLSHSPLAHLPIFLFGVLGGYVVLRLRQPSARGGSMLKVVCEVLFWLSAVGLVAIASLPAADRLEIPYGRYFFPWMPGFAAMAMIAAPSAPFARRLLDVPPLRWLGTISYGVYIYQIACMQLVLKLLERAGFKASGMKLQFAVLSFGVTVVVAACSYLLFERPLVRWAERLSTPQKQRVLDKETGAPLPAPLGS
jgi:peptidoglycan/LPS O-acetylase OafA/YrhL